MKVRTNYVSNSSSSSFCIVGVAIDSDDMGEFFDGFNPDEDELYEFLEGSLTGELTFHRGLGEYSEDTYVIGTPIQAIKDEQTFKEFKQQVFKALKESGFKGEESDVKIHEDGGYDG